MNVVHLSGHRWARFLALCTALAAGACADAPPTAPGPAPMDDAGFVAQALAGAMADDGVRHTVRDAMRFSERDGHKLVLQEYLASADGAGLLDAAGRAAGIEPAELLRRLNALPTLDFYMPVRAHRRSWRGDANIAVIAARDGGEYLPAHTPGGAVLRASRRSADGLPPFFFLEPSEPAGRRVDAQARIPGNVIEDATDGEGSEVMVYRPLDGEPIVVDVALLSPGERATSSNISASMDTTRVGVFEHFNCDNGYCWTDAEFRFNAHYYSASGVLLGTGEYRRGSMAPGVLYTLNAPLIFDRILAGSGEYMDITLVEEDRNDPFGVNNDDYCGVERIGSGSNGGYVVYENQSNCQGGVDEGYLYGYVAEARFDWTTKLQPNPPPPPPPVIQGPLGVRPGESCTWYAAHDLSDPSYEWYVDGVLVGTSQEVQYASQWSFSLELQVTSAQGGGAYSSMYVDVSSGFPQCSSPTQGP